MLFSEQAGYIHVLVAKDIMCDAMDKRKEGVYMAFPLFYGSLYAPLGDYCCALMISTAR